MAPMLFSRWRLFVFAAGSLLGVGLAPSTSLGALASLTGGSTYSGVLSSNKTIRHQQLICDPTPGSGSATVIYDPSVVTLEAIYNEPNYQLNANQTYVGLTGGPTPGSYQVTDANTYFLYGADVGEAGLVQVTWTSSPGAAYASSTIVNQNDISSGIPSLPSDPSTFTQVASDKTNDGGTNVFGLEFEYVDPSDATPASYTIFADNGETIFYNEGQTAPDQLMDGQGNVIPAGQIASATVTGSLVPEPSSLGLLALAALALGARRRARRPINL